MTVKKALYLVTISQNTAKYSYELDFSLFPHVTVQSLKDFVKVTQHTSDIVGTWTQTDNSKSNVLPTMAGGLSKRNNKCGSVRLNYMRFNFASQRKQQLYISFIQFQLIFYKYVKVYTYTSYWSNLALSVDHSYSQ